jgi:putative tryptophan/tyrosine transport system substrate-binding protein
MDRRRFLLTSLGGACAAPIVAGAEQPRGPRRIGVLAMQEDPAWQGLWEGLRRFGWIEGRTIAVERRFALGPRPSEQLTDQARDLVGLGVDVIVAAGRPAADAAREATSTIPIVFLACGCGSPVMSGFVHSRACPGGNMTGVVSVSTRVGYDYGEDLAPKRRELLSELLPRGGTLAILSSSLEDFEFQADWSLRTFGLEVQRAACSGPRGWPQTIDVHTDDEIEWTFARMARETSSGVLVLQPELRTDRARIKERARQYKLEPVDINELWFMLAALVFYRSNPTEHYRQAALYVHMILNGAAPAELPVGRTLSKLDLVIERRAAKTNGFTVPLSLLARADHVID